MAVQLKSKAEAKPLYPYSIAELDSVILFLRSCPKPVLRKMRLRGPRKKHRIYHRKGGPQRRQVVRGVYIDYEGNHTES